MRGFFVPSLLFFVTAAVVQAENIFETLEISTDVVNPDGHPRSAVVINGITPGPVLTGFKGDDFIVTVVNHINDPNLRRSTTVHWHGILQPRKAYDDGPAFVTQCPIAPNNSYTYYVETAEQAGTFWYHSHLSSQYIDGLRGALILYDRDDPHASLYDVDDESTIISLTDWYQQAAEGLGHAWINGTGPEPVPDSNLFNGVGRYANGGGSDIPRPVMVVQQGKRYRFRIINMSAIVPFNFAIEGHTLTVIEADGENHEPLGNITSVSISAGQRYSIILNANQPVKNYWIAYPSNFRVTAVPKVNPNYNGTEAFAVLRYQGAPEAEPTTPQLVPDNSNALKEQDLVPLVSPNLPDEADLVIPLRFRPENPGEDESTPGGANNWTVNGAQYTPPSMPTLLRILHHGATNQSDFNTTENTYVLPYNATVDVQLIGDSHHPFHLHGHTFQVIKSADVNAPRNTVNPPIRDTVDTNDESDPEKAVTIRFRTDNPGPWFLHCHKDWHLEAGLAVVFAEDPEDMRFGPKSLEPPAEWDNLCPIYEKLPKELQ